MTTCKDRLESYLREHQVKYETQHHPPAYTSQEVAASEHVPGKQVAKVVMALADGKLVMLALPAPAQVNFARAKQALGASQVRLAEESEFAETFPDCEVGAMPPFGNLYDVPVFVDSSLAEDEVIYFDAGTHTDTMSLDYADFNSLVQPTVAEFAEPA